jgi:16S rRNA (guanine527-N7)-methyltransferase
MPAQLTPETEQRLQAYSQLLLTWTRRINLISAADQPHIWTRHIHDSLRLIPHIPEGTTRAIDLGSGAGLPGLVLAIATGIQFDLIESDRRKAAFLLEAARVTGAPAKIHPTRIEDTAIPPAPLITARALAPLEKLLALATPLLAPGGTMLFLKGARAPEEIAAARQTWTFDCAIHGEDHPILAITNPHRAHAHA